MSSAQSVELSQIALGLPPSAPIPEPASSALRILPLSDLHLPTSTSAAILANRKYLDSMDYVVFLGDMARCYGTNQEYRAVADFVKQVERPFTAIIGNHEWFFHCATEESGTYGQIWREGTGAEKRVSLERFQTFWNKPVLWRAQSHALGHFVFLSIDAIDSPKPEALSTPQLEFLAGEIERAGSAPLFVFCHTPLNLGSRLDLIYYEPERTACVDADGDVLRLLSERQAPTFWISGHVHLRPDHYMFPPYICGGNVWQIHCPDSAGYGRWHREQIRPEGYEGLFSRHLEIDTAGVTFVSHNQLTGQNLGHFRVDYALATVVAGGMD